MSGFRPDIIKNSIKTTHEDLPQLSEDYRSWSVSQILEHSPDLKAQNFVIKTGSLHSAIVDGITVTAQKEKIILSFASSHPEDILRKMQSRSDIPFVSTESVWKPFHGVEVVVSCGVSGQDTFTISLPKSDARFDFEALGLNPFFIKDTLPRLGTLDSHEKNEAIHSLLLEGVMHFAERPDVQVRVAESVSNIASLIVPEKHGMKRLFKGSNVETAFSMLRKGIFSSVESPNLSEVLTGEVTVALDGYAEQYGEDSYSTLLVIDCMPDEYEHQGGYENFGVAKKEIKKNPDYFHLIYPYISDKHNRYIPPDRITEVIFVKKK